MYAVWVLRYKYIFAAALPRQKYPEANEVSPRADQPERLTQAEGDKRESLDCKPEFAIEILSLHNVHRPQFRTFDMGCDLKGVGLEIVPAPVCQVLRFQFLHNDGADILDHRGF